ncbi:mCG57332, partial [Mus musculus]
LPYPNGMTKTTSNHQQVSRGKGKPPLGKLMGLQTSESTNKIGSLPPYQRVFIGR